MFQQKRVLGCSGQSRSLGKTIVPGDVLTYPPGGEHDRIYEGAAAFAGLMFDRAELPRFFAAEQQGADEDFWKKHRHFRFAEKAPRCRPEALLTLLASRLQADQALCSAGADYWKRALLDAFLGPIAIGPVTGVDRAIPSSARMVREVERYLESNRDRAVHVSEICEKIKVSRRTLYRAFDDAVGIGPIDFLRAKRLSIVHSKLRQACPEETGVAQIATELGFLELGRFAQQYRSLFGEHPHQTLRRDSKKNSSEPFRFRKPEKPSPKEDPLPRTIWHKTHNDGV